MSFSNAANTAVQETKLLSLEKLTKDLACVPGFESFWAVSREKKGYSGETSLHAILTTSTCPRADTLPKPPVCSIHKILCMAAANAKSDCDCRHCQLRER